MKTIVTSLFALFMAIAPLARAQQLPSGHPQIAPASQPSDQPALPSGHPSIEQPSLPAGHPPMPNSAQGELPQGHPQIAPSSQPSLPAGHPQVPAGAGVVGQLAIFIKNGSINGTPLTGDAVNVEFFDANRKLVGSAKSKLDDKGMAMINDIPLTNPVQPIITITHAGIPYRGAADPMDAQNPRQQAEMPVFDPTDTPAAWTMKKRHYMIENAGDALMITDMIAIQNIATNTWPGTAMPDGSHVTMNFTLPEGATDVMVDNDPKAALVVGNKVDYLKPIYPGQVEMQIKYKLPIKGDSMDITIPAPANIIEKQMMVLIPKDGTKLTSADMAESSTNKISMKMRFFYAKEHKAGESVKLNLSGLSSAKPVSIREATEDAQPPHLAEAAASQDGHVHAHDTASAGIPQVAKYVGGIGAGLIVLIGLGIAFFRQPAKAQVAEQAGMKSKRK